jgi:hypothetical protein
MKISTSNSNQRTGGNGELPSNSELRFTPTMIAGILESLAIPLLSLWLLGSPEARAAAPRLEDSGDLEHYHHEFYSHSYVDPNYREDLNTPPKNGFSKSKPGRKPIQRNTNVSIALGGHRHHHHR